MCICYTADVLTSNIYNIDYYRSVAKQVRTNAYDA